MSDNGIRVTVNLSSGTRQAMEGTSILAGESRTDVINKAVQAYAWIRELQLLGGQLLVVTPGEKNPTAVTLR